MQHDARLARARSISAVASKTTRPSGWAYRLQATKGDKTFIATIATPRGPTYTDSSTIEVR